MGRINYLQPLALVVVFSVSSAVRAADAPAASAATPAPKVNYQDHILPIFRNTCLNCHNPDKKKGNLDLSTYVGMAAGGGGGKAVEPGDPDSSKLYKAVTWAEEPNMPPKGDKLAEKDLKVIREWIAGGAPETSGSKVVINKPKTNLAVVAIAGKPTGPVAMPKDLSIEPVAVPKRAAALTSLAASPWAPVIAVGGQRQIVLYHAQTLEILGILPYPEGIAYSLRFSPNGALLLAGGGVGAKSGRVVAFDVATGKRVAEVGDEFDAVLTSDISPDQTQVALGTPLKTLKIYNTSDGSQEHAVKKHTDWVQAVAYSPDGKYLASGDRAGGLWVWEAKTAREVYNCAGHKDGVTDACFRGDSGILLSASQDGTFKLWNMTDGTMAKTITAHAGGVLSASFTHDGRIVTCGRDNLVKLWSPDGTLVKAFEPFGDIALRATFTSDANRVVAGDYSGAIRVWDVADGKRAGELTAGPPTPAQQLANFDQRMKDLQAAADKAAADLKAAQDGASAAAKDLKATTDAQAAAAKLLETSQAQLNASTAEVTNKARAATAALPARRAAVETFNFASTKSKAALVKVTAEVETLRAKVAAQRAAAEEANAAAAKAKAAADAKPADAALAAAYKEKAEVAAEKSAVVAETVKAHAAASEQVKPLTAAIAKADADAKAAADMLAADKIAAKLTPETSPQVAAAKQAIAKAKADLDASIKAIPARTEANKSAGERLAKADAAAKAAALQIEGAKGQRLRLEAAVNKQPAKAAKS